MARFKARRPFIFAVISCHVALALGASVRADEYFNPALLSLDNPSLEGADLSLFEQGGAQAPGIYRVDLFLNGENVESRDVDFALEKDAEGNAFLQPCLSKELLESLGVKPSELSSQDAGDECVDLAKAIALSSAKFEFHQQRLNLTIPQAALYSQARGYVSPDKFEQGINALLLNYSFSGAHSKGRQGDVQGSDNYYLNLRSGLNVGAWRLRNYSTWNRDSNGEDRWDSINSYLQRDVIPLKSQFTLGDSASPSDVFDSVPFRGAQLASDDEMLPESMKGYSPVVKGIANTNAQVTIYQNGYQIYQNYVPPGAFEISDLYPTAGSGDLNVVVKEADGSERSFVVPFASVPVLQREGRLKFSVTGGQYRPSNGDIDKQSFVQGTAIYGLPWGLTTYGGIQSAGDKYFSTALGLGKNMGWVGAVSVDMTDAKATLKDLDSKKGQSWRLRYSKNFVDTGTNFSLAGYRYSTSGFYTMQEGLDSYNNKYNSSDRNYDHKKSRSELLLSQRLWDNGGSLSVSLSNEEYWNNHRRVRSAGVAYNGNWNSVNYGLNYTYSQNRTDSSTDSVADDHLFSFNVSVPLDKWLSNSYASYGLNSSRNGKTVHTVGVNGTALAGNNLSYNVSQGYEDSGGGTTGNAGLNFKGGYGEASAAYSYDRNMYRVNYGLRGGVVMHSDGITLSQPFGETAALVKAPQASDVRVMNGVGVSTDWRGYTVVPYVSPYRKTPITLDTASLKDDVDMTLTSQMVIPTRGAMARAEFSPNVGLRMLISLTKKNGDAVPFGSVASLQGDRANSAIVGDDGDVFMTGMPEQGSFVVKWGNDASQQCNVAYQANEAQETSGIYRLSTVCL